MEKSLFIEKLNNSNYSLWSFKMKMYLIREGCWKVISEETTGMKPEDVMVMNEKALSLIALMVENDQLVHIRKANGGKEAWNILMDFHKKTSLVSQIRVMKKLFKMELGQGESMKDHLQRIFEYFSDLTEMDAKLDDSIAVCVILASLNEDYDTLITALEAWDPKVLTIQAVKSKLIEEWERKEEREGATAFIAKRKIGKEFTCYYCGKPGHMKRNCELLKEERNKQFRNKEYESAKMARFQEWYPSVSVQGRKNDWFVDSGASSHMCRDITLFSNLETIDPVKIEIADGKTIVANKRGVVPLTINLPSGNNMSINLNNVLLVPQLNDNLISVRRLTQIGFSVIFKGELCTLSSNGDSMDIATYRNSMYRINVHRNNDDSTLACPVVEKESFKCVHEWHSALAHRNISDILDMKVFGLNIRDCSCKNLCESCIKGKMHKQSFPKKGKGVENVLDCVVTDVCGPIPVESYDHFKYFITFTDLYSKYTEVYLLKYKSEVEVKVKQFIEKMKNVKGMKPKAIRSDRGGEYMQARLQKYIADEGI